MIHGVCGARALPPRPLSAPPMTQHGAHGPRPLPRRPLRAPPMIQSGPRGPQPIPPRPLSAPTIHHGAYGLPALPRRQHTQPRPALCGLAAQLLQRTSPTCRIQSRALSHRGLVLLLLTTATTPRGCSRSRRALHQLRGILPLSHQLVRITQPESKPQTYFSQLLPPMEPLPRIDPGLALLGKYSKPTFIQFPADFSIVLPQSLHSRVLPTPTPRRTQLQVSLLPLPWLWHRLFTFLGG